LFTLGIKPETTPQLVDFPHLPADALRSVLAVSTGFPREPVVGARPQTSAKLATKSCRMLCTGSTPRSCPTSRVSS